MLVVLEARSVSFLMGPEMEEKVMQETPDKYRIIWDNILGDSRSTDIKLQRVIPIVTPGYSAGDVELNLVKY